MDFWTDLNIKLVSANCSSKNNPKHTDGPCLAIYSFSTARRQGYLNLTIFYRKNEEEKNILVPITQLFAKKRVLFFDKFSNFLMSELFSKCLSFNSNCQATIDANVETVLCPTVQLLNSAMSKCQNVGQCSVKLSNGRTVLCPAVQWLVNAVCSCSMAGELSVQLQSNSQTVL